MKNTGTGIAYIEFEAGEHLLELVGIIRPSNLVAETDVVGVFNQCSEHLRVIGLGGYH